MTEHSEKNKQDTPKNRHQGVRRFIAGPKRLWVILLFAGIALTILALLLSMKTAGLAVPNKSLGTFTVRRDDLIITVTESGSINAHNSIDIKSEVEGQVTILSIVPEGTYITQQDVDNGKVLVELDSSNMEEQYAQKEIDLASAEASYAEAKETYDIQLKQNESDITEAEMEVRFGLMDFKKYLGETVAKKFIEDVNQTSALDIDIASLLKHPQLDGESLQKLRELNDNITLTESKLAKAVLKLEGTQKLYDSNYVAEIELKGDELDVQSLEIQKQRALTDLKLFKLYEFPKEAEKLLSDYREAGRELERTNARARSKLAQAQAKLKSAKSRFRLQKDRLAKFKKQIDACTIKAPAPGLVVYSSSRGGMSRRRVPIEEGEKVYQSQKIISLPDTAEMVVEISIHESSVDKVRPGQTAKIVMDAFPDETFHGKVLKVSQLPDAQRSWLSPDLKVYTTEVSIEGSYDFLKPGMSAKVEILVEHLPDVIIVPIQVVANRGGKKVCYVMASAKPELREVQTGAFNDTFVQIIDGLEVGEDVLLNPPRITEPPAASRLKQQREPTQRQEPSREQKPMQSRRRELTDEAIEGPRRPSFAGGNPERMMSRLAETNPEKAQELERLREKDPEKFKAELRKAMREQYRSRQSKRGMSERTGNARAPQNH